MAKSKSKVSKIVFSPKWKDYSKEEFIDRFKDRFPELDLGAEYEKIVNKK